MPDLTSVVITILRKYARDPEAAIGSATTLGELEIDRLDLPMIGLDLEEVYDVQIDHGDEVEEPVRVGDLLARLSARLAEKAAPRPRPPRRRSTWLSTGA
jgi:hypothetical protein